MSWKTILDRYLTTPPDDGFDGWHEEVLGDRITDAFYTIHEDWILDNNGVCNKWLNKLYYKKGMQPTEAAQLIERAFYFNKLNIKS